MADQNHSASEIAEVERETSELLSRLIRIDTSNPPGNETAVAEFMDAWFREAGLFGEIVGETPERCSYVLRLPGRRPGPTLLLLAHEDVAPANAEDWQATTVRGRDRRRLRLGSRCDRHQEPRRGQRRRRQAPGRRRVVVRGHGDLRVHRERGGLAGRGSAGRRPLAHREPSRAPALRLPAERGRWRRHPAGRTEDLHRRERGEGRRPLPAGRPGRGWARRPAAAPRQCDPGGGSSRRGPPLSRAPGGRRRRL